MANANSPSGATLIGHLYGSSYNARITSYVVPATDNIAIYVGDFVKLTGTGSTDANGLVLPSVTAATVGSTLVGVVVGFQPDSTYLNQIYRTASTLRTVFVCDDPYALFSIQTSGTAAVTDFNQNADIVLGTPSIPFGTSGTQLDQTTVASDADLQLRILQLDKRPDNEMGLYAKLVCMINEHAFKTPIGS